ncbi:YCII domain-containing protein [Mycena chlorophos]|uniref:YCII domain-containing protein n=1 Tax=Mycena chlorophos TaxID=658473 RepID=A0A8H6TRC9_MYCCL|nr:YCII domain-containing protein [Mycena chlorophos]
MSDAVKLHNFIVFAPDKEGVDRQPFRPEHLQRILEFHATGVLKYGGMMATPESITGGEQKLVSVVYSVRRIKLTHRIVQIGSLVIIQGESLEAVRKIIEDDAYYRNGIWDPERLVILPFVLGLPWAGIHD